MNRHKLLRWLAALLLAALVLSACDTPQVTPTAAPSDTPSPAQPRPTTAPTEIPLPTLAPTAEPAPTAPAANRYEGWLTYTEAEHGFSFRYPSDWTLAEDLNAVSTSYRHRVQLSPPGQPLVVLAIGFKRVGEEAGIHRTGVGSGDLIVKGTLTFMGEPVQREVLVSEGKDMAVLYRGDARTRRGELEFALDLGYRGLYTDPSALTTDVEATADLIIESFALTP